MSNLLEAGGQVERTFGREPFFGPAAGSIALHVALACSIVFYALLNGLFHHNTWGGTQDGGAIQVQLTSTLPLPAEKVNDNVLATETPSEAPAPPAPKQQQVVDTTAIPITGKAAKPKPAPAVKTQPHQPPPKPVNRAQYGEQAGTLMPRAVQAGAGPATVSDGDFGNRFPWYVDGILRKMQGSWDKREVDASTPKGVRAYIAFTIRRDGSPTQVEVDRSSGSATLDRSCIRGAQRVDTFGLLPAAYNQSTLKVSYYCEY
jgi:protein TonB